MIWVMTGKRNGVKVYVSSFNTPDGKELDSYWSESIDNAYLFSSDDVERMRKILLSRTIGKITYIDFEQI